MDPDGMNKKLSNAEFTRVYGNDDTPPRSVMKRVGIRSVAETSPFVRAVLYV